MTRFTFSPRTIIAIRKAIDFAALAAAQDSGCRVGTESGCLD